MSRGFVKEGDQEEPPIIPSRAVLPKGVPNYVTPKGFKALKKEKMELLEELSLEDSLTEKEKRKKSAEINGKLKLLNERINSARVLDIQNQEIKKVKFGTKVTYKINGAKSPITITIVGVDEANTKRKKIAFIAPIAKAMIGKKEKDTVHFSIGDEKRILKIIKIEKEG